jgi:hypothetical protein
MLRILATVGFAIAAAGAAFAQAEYKGKHFDVFGGDKAAVEKRGRQCDEVGERFQKIMGLKEVKRGAVTLTPGGQGVDAKKNGAVWTFQWPEAMGGFPGMGGDDMDPFTHELGHMILVHHVNDGCADSLKKSFNGYGSYLKDWLDECFACIHEPEGMKNTRRQQIKQHVQKGDYLKLRELFEMNHPIGGQGHGGLPRGGAPGGGGVPGATGRMPELPGGPPGGGGGLPGGAPGGAGAGGGGGGGLMDANKFYVECLSVLEFLLDQYGEEFVRHVVATFQQAKNMDDALKTYKGKLKRARLAKDTDELERQWLGWVKGT